MSTKIFSTLLVVYTASVQAVSPVPQQIAPPETTCKIYALAHEFARGIQSMTNMQDKAVFDALKLHVCVVVLKF